MYNTRVGPPAKPEKKPEKRKNPLQFQCAFDNICGTRAINRKSGS